MKKLMFWNGIFALLASYTIAMKLPVVPAPPKIEAHADAEQIERQVQYERAEKDALSVMARYGCNEDIRDYVSRSAVDNGVPARLLAAEVVVESSCRTGVISKAGAVGLLQVMPSVWNESREDLQDPEYNIRTGTRILAAQIRRYGKRDGLRHYFGVTEDSTASDEYANKVLGVAR